ncbi:MAG: hypothetical protein KA138_03715, partial [Saprospiraceae bacterium]|nr:hypothetical protein [Saprospiraceae bacterium]
MAHYEPGVGIVNEQVFSDSLLSITQHKSPIFVEIDDSTIVAIGNKYMRKLRHHANGTFSEEWVKPIDFNPTSAVWEQNKIVVTDLSGAIRAFDEMGNLLWTKYFPLETRKIKTAPNGLIVGGYGDTLEPIILRLDSDGNLLWSTTTLGNNFHDLTATSDGGFALLSHADSSKILITKIGSTGNVLWTKEYGKGRGLSIVDGIDGGLAILYQDSANKMFLMKTDDLGETGLPKTAHIRDRTLQTSGFKTTQLPSSTLFFNGDESGLFIPADSATSPIFAHSPWLAGQDPGNNLKVGASTYGDNSNYSFRTGIITSPAEDFNRVWSISREEIAHLRRDYGEDGVVDATPPFDLLTWPAKGNPYFRQNLDFTLTGTNPDSLPAPFVDVNSDSLYNVFDGDYPQLKGDRMLWWAMSDRTGPFDTYPNFNFFFTLYGYDCPQNELVSKSLFYDCHVINWQSDRLDDAFLGFFTDFNLGCHEDDYIGSMPDVNSFYAYNQDSVDGQSNGACSSGTATYMDKIPVQSITMLNHSLDRSMYIIEYDIGVNPGQIAPTSPQEYYNYLQSIWRDGTPFTQGGSAYNPSNPNGIAADYVFPGNPTDPQGWSLCTANLPDADRRLLNSHGPFKLLPEQSFTMRLAFTFHPDIPHPCPDVTSLVKPTILQIQQWHDDGTLEAHVDLGGVLTLEPGQSLQLNAWQYSPATTYAWSTGQNTSSIIVNQTGEYTVTVTPATGCTYSETVWVKSSSGTNSPTLLSWQVLPNPASNILSIVFEKNEMSVTALLRNAQGQIVSSK